MHIKKLILSVCLMFSVVSCYGNDEANNSAWQGFCSFVKGVYRVGGYAYDGVKAMGQADRDKQIVDQGLQAFSGVAEGAVKVQEMAGIVVESADKLKAVAQGMDALNQRSAQLLDGVNNVTGIVKQNAATTEQIKDTLERWTPAQKVIAGVMIAGSIASIAQVSYKGYYWIKAWWYPNEQEKIQRENTTEQSKEQIKIRKAKQAFYECLAKNNDADEDNEGIPFLCKKTAKEFALAVGPRTLREDIKAFRENKKFIS